MHNFRLCEFLQQQGETYNDWIITTAFYSALNLVKDNLFPGEHIVGNRSRFFQDFDDYWSFVRNKAIHSGQHFAVIDLVDEHLSGIAEHYDILYTNCMKARYNEYKMDTEVKTISLQALHHILDSLQS